MSTLPHINHHAGSPCCPNPPTYDVPYPTANCIGKLSFAQDKLYAPSSLTLPEDTGGRPLEFFLGGAGGGNIAVCRQTAFAGNNVSLAMVAVPYSLVLSWLFAWPACRGSILSFRIVQKKSGNWGATHHPTQQPLCGRSYSAAMLPDNIHRRRRPNQLWYAMLC